MVQLRRVGVLSVAKVMALVNGAIGVVIAPFLLLMAGVMATIAPTGQKLPASIFVVEAVVIPFMYAGLGFLFGALLSWFYNLVAAKLGGIEVEFGEMVPAPVNPVVTAQS